MVLRFFIFALSILLPACISASTEYIIKFATLVPPDTAWMNEIDKWSQQLSTRSNGRLKLKIYPGGVMGDEPDVIRKLRSNQLQAAFLTGYGIGQIYSPARILEMPFLFKNNQESDYVRNNLMPEIKQGFQSRGFELLGWPEVGFIHFFSKKPINSLTQLKKTRIWLWQGDRLGEAFAKSAGISYIPLSIIDVYSQLSSNHGSIDTVYNSPFGILAMQWHTKLNYASNIPFTNAIGSFVINKNYYDKLPGDLQLILSSTGWETAENINKVTRADNAKSIQLLHNAGIDFMWNWDKNEELEMLSIRDQASALLYENNYIPEKFFTNATSLLIKFRKNK